MNQVVIECSIGLFTNIPSLMVSLTLVQPVEALQPEKGAMKADGFGTKDVPLYGPHYRNLEFILYMRKFYSKVTAKKKKQQISNRNILKSSKRETQTSVTTLAKVEKGRSNETSLMSGETHLENR